MANVTLKVFSSSTNCSAKDMTTIKQRVAAKQNIKKAAKAAGRKRTVAKKTRTALGKEGAKAARKKRTGSK
jgi:hypothetical protein